MHVSVLQLGTDIKPAQHVFASLIKPRKKVKKNAVPDGRQSNQSALWSPEIESISLCGVKKALLCVVVVDSRM